MVAEYYQRRVVITGMGVVAPNGCDLDTFWNSIRDGRSAVDRVTRFDTSDMPTRIAAEIRGFDCGRFVESTKHVRRLSLSIQYGLAAAALAIKDAGVDTTRMDSDRIGLVEATVHSGIDTITSNIPVYQTRGYRGISPYHLINANNGGGSGEIAIVLGIKGNVLTLSSGCASGNDAIGFGYDLIMQDDADIMVAGGSEAALNVPIYGGFCVARAMSNRNQDPKGAMRPFDKDRDGFVLGEGAGYIVLEEYTHAIARGAKIHAEIRGYGRSCDAYHSVKPSPDGKGLCRAMEKAFRKARMSPDEIEYINAHGTATESNDVVESLAIKSFFKTHANRLAVSSTKPVTGHLMAASGSVEAIVCALALKHQQIPPTINLREPAKECDLDYVPGKARPYPLRHAVNLSVGFGGKNSCLILSRA